MRIRKPINSTLYVLGTRSLCVFLNSGGASYNLGLVASFTLVGGTPARVTHTAHTRRQDSLPKSGLSHTRSEEFAVSDCVLSMAVSAVPRITQTNRACLPCCSPDIRPGFWASFSARLSRKGPLVAWRFVRVLRRVFGVRGRSAPAVHFAHAVADSQGEVLDTRARPCKPRQRQSLSTGRDCCDFFSFLARRR
jgi:hypothetical protein